MQAQLDALLSALPNIDIDIDIAMSDADVSSSVFVSSASSSASASASSSASASPSLTKQPKDKEKSKSFSSSSSQSSSSQGSVDAATVKLLLKQLSALWLECNQQSKQSLMAMREPLAKKLLEIQQNGQFAALEKAVAEKSEALQAIRSR